MEVYWYRRENIMTSPQIEYGPSEWKIVGYSFENGQAIVQTVVCTRFDCQEWQNGQPIAPLLVRNKQGLRICPKCRCSYGA